MENRVKILVMCPDLPFPIRAGGQMRMASLVQALARFAKVHVACIASQIPEITSSWANDFNITIEKFSRPPIRNYQVWRERITMVLTGSNLLHRSDEQYFFDEVFDRFNPDLVWLETPYLIRYALPWKRNVPILVDHWGTSEGSKRIFEKTHGLRKIWPWLRWRTIKGGELRYTPQLENIVCVSKLDAGYFKRIAPNSLVWPVPIGILKKSETPKKFFSSPEQKSTMILTGDMSYLPNIDAAIWFTKEILSLIQQEVPYAKLQLVGRAPTTEIKKLTAYPGVEVTGYVPDLAKTIANSALYVLPMRLGSGIRSKLFDVFPLGKAVVSTTIGVEGLELHNNENCLIADSAVDFAKACAKLLNDEKERKRLGNAVRHLATKTYTQDNVTRLIHHTVDEILRNRVHAYSSNSF